MSELTKDLEQHLERFGLSSFRPGQRDVVTTVLEGRDCLCIMPTGGGKSLCYQLPSIVREGTTLVVSPLIALMKDQVDALHELNIRATCINSTLTQGEQHERIDRMAAGEYDLVYVAPERFRNPWFFDAVRRCNLQLLAIDEAHCVSEWGHDFRPDYARIGNFRKRLGYPQTMALTATATPLVREDVVKTLELKQPATFITGFSRPNLKFEVQSPYGPGAKDEALIRFLNATPGCGIIYASTRKRCDELTLTLNEQCSRKTGVYHAGLMPDERREVQEEFMSGRLPVIVATNAFGMGIDKSDLRFVVHYNMPGSLEAYYQEAGRAGRDGKDSRCVLLFSVQDRYVQEFFIENSYPSREVVAQVYEFLRSQEDDPIEITLLDLKDQLELSLGADGVGACERLLEKAGVLERLDPQQNMAAARIDSELPTLIDVLPREAKVRRKVLRAVEQVVGDLRYERVYFNPSKIEEATGLGKAAVSRALKGLNELKYFDYVPPFRGRAIHMLERNRQFSQLQLDFSELERRRADEYAKLDRVIQFARARRCRQVEILDYFGDPELKACGNCDNCEKSGGAAASDSSGNPAAAVEGHVVHAGVVEAVLITLSGVKRCKSRFGREVVAQMLCGSRSAKMQKFKLTSLSTYGLLSHLKIPDVTMLIDALLNAGMLETSDVDRFRPVLEITSYGVAVMRSKEPIDRPLQLPAPLEAAITGHYKQKNGGEGGLYPGDAAGGLNRDVERALRSWRNDKAKSENSPPYRIFSNATMELLATQCPQNLDALSGVKGIGPATVASYGADIIEVITGQAPDAGEEPASNDLFEDIPSPKQAAPHPESSKPETRKKAAKKEPAKKISQPPPAAHDAAPVDKAPHVEHVRQLFDETTPPEAAKPKQKAAVDRSAPEPVKRPAAEQKTRSDTNTSQPSTTQPPPHFWTWRLLSSEFTLHECTQIRGLTPMQIMEHALRALEQGLPAKPEWLLSTDQIAALKVLVPGAPPKQLKDLAPKLPADISLTQLEYFIKCRE